ncbi:hypothetical protein ZWY2020_012412 [Hordeum vulgare]|nr:hypothetical protein ZWY2020_012412 [Hordeum vulgare]
MGIHLPAFAFLQVFQASAPFCGRSTSGCPATSPSSAPLCPARSLPTSPGCAAPTRGAGTTTTRSAAKGFSAQHHRRRPRRRPGFLFCGSTLGHFLPLIERELRDVYRAGLQHQCAEAVNIRYPFLIDTDNAWDCGYPSIRLECCGHTPVLRLPSGEYAVTDILYDDTVDGDRRVPLFDLGVFTQQNNTCPFVGRKLAH